MEILYDLLFELSNEDRMGILFHLLKKKSRLTQLSRNLDLPVQEISRQLSRLENVCLVRKDVEGFYVVTPYAEHVLEFLPGLRFLSEHREYFISHTVSTLPKNFVLRIGSLDRASYVGDVMVAFSNVENAIRAAQERIWILTDQILMSTLPLLQEAEERGVEFHLLVPKNIEPPPAFWERRDQMTEHHSPHSEQIQTKWLDEVVATMTLTENEVAHLSFQSTDSDHDYMGFRAFDEESMTWCRDLFLHIWGNASNRIPEHLLNR